MQGEMDLNTVDLSVYVNKSVNCFSQGGCYAKEIYYFLEQKYTFHQLFRTF